MIAQVSGPIRQPPAAAAACDRAIDADPKMPDPYFVKASALAGEGARHAS
jgi:hypothetical protein